MGDRISISFVNGKDESVAFFSHFDGVDLKFIAEGYVRELKKKISKMEFPAISTPLSRLEPNYVMLDFIRWFIKENHLSNGLISTNYYLGKDGNDGDNSDNGHHKIFLSMPTLKDVTRHK